jgi:hypothetical protein
MQLPDSELNVPKSSLRKKKLKVIPKHLFMPEKAESVSSKTDSQQKKVKFDVVSTWESAQ